MLCEFRSDNKEGLAFMEKQFRAIFDRPGIEVQLVGERPCENLSPEAEAQREALICQAEARMERITGKRSKREPGSTDCNIPLANGIPAAAIGLCVGAGEHTRGEWIETESLKAGFPAGRERRINDAEL